MNLDPKNRAEVYYDRILKQLDDISNGTSDSESGSEGLNPVNRAEIYYKMILDKIDEIADGGSGGDIDPAVIEQAVSDWLTAHPEATTTVADGSITYNKLDANLKGKADAVSSLSDEIAGIQDTLEKMPHNKINESGKVQSGTTTNADGSITIPAGTFYFAYYNLEQLKGDGILRIEITPVSNVAVYKNSQVSGGGAAGYGTATQIDTNTIGLTIDHNAIDPANHYAVIRFDNRTGSSTVTVNKITFMDSEIIVPEFSAMTAWVSASGSDSNDGTKNSPFATVNKALQNGAQTVCVIGGVYKQIIDLANAQFANIEIRNGSQYNRVIFEDPNCVLATTENLESGYTKVYSASVSATIASDNNWIYQDSVPDADTLIEDTERLPLQRGYIYRCEDTRIVKCTATTLADALTEIENSTEYKWFYTSGKLYYSRPQTVNATHPICYSSGLDLFDNTISSAKGISVKVVGIETKYMGFNVTNLSTAEIIDCKSANAYAAGGFTYDKNMSAKFVRCEVCRCQKGSNGDGFNGHGNNLGDVTSKQVGCTLIDCWSHDNRDDGYSDHERSETLIIGGLYEYNSKGGITPSYGSHCTCYDVISRHNYSGFYCCGEVASAEGGKGTQMLCVSCVAENNTNSGTGYGFCVVNTGNLARLIHCKSIGNRVGYVAIGAKLILTDCGAYGNTAERDGTINMEFRNTSIVTGA